MGKINLLKNAEGNVIYPVTIGDAVAVDGKTLTVALAAKLNEITESNKLAASLVSGLATVATSGSYNNLSDKPTIPAAQIQSDWNQTSTTAKDFIKNKPTIPAAQIQSDWNQTTTTAKDYIKNKPTLPTNKAAAAGGTDDTLVTTGDKASWNAKQDALSFEGTYNATSNKVATMSAVNDAVSDAMGDLAGALVYKGTIGTGGTVTALPATHSVGDVYVVSTAGTYAGKACEVGDYIICKTAGTTANNAHWDVLNGENQVSASIKSTDTGAYKIGTVDGVDLYGKDTNTTYTSKTAASGGTDTSLVTTGEKYTWNNKGTYSKPTNGIPKTDLAAAVQTSLGKADTALQASDIAGKQDSITANGILKGDNGTISAATAGTDYLVPVTAVTAATADSASTKSTEIICKVTQGTDGQIAVTKSAYTIAKSVPSNAVFTDTKAASSLTCTSAKYGGSANTTSVQTALNNLSTAVGAVSSSSITVQALTSNTTEYSDTKIAAIVDIAAADTTIQ